MASISPMSQVLATLGLTREDLSERSKQMREFLDEPSSESSTDEEDGPTTPTKNRRIFSVKTECGESGGRALDNMEQVIERQRQIRSSQRKARSQQQRQQQQHQQQQPESYSYSSTSAPLSLDAFMNARKDKRVDRTPVKSVTTPKSSSPYYRDHTHDSSRKIPKHESPSPSLYRQSLLPQQPLPLNLPSPPFVKQEPTPAHDTHSQTQPQRYATTELLYAHASSLPGSTLYANPSLAYYSKSPLPSSSPPPPPPQTSSPVSSSPAPTHRVLALSPSSSSSSSSTSSSHHQPQPQKKVIPSPPTTIAPTNVFPFTLPPGPYSHKKPSHSYAAMVGQAILSSADHRLTLQDIYAYITTVYPHYKRGELTWMNSIRHVLSTTACFRKVVRDRAAGRSLWAIWDEDLACFEQGGFKRGLCGDIVKAKEEGGAVTKPRASRKRAAPSGDGSSSSVSARQPVAKKAKTNAGSSNLTLGGGYAVSMGYIPPTSYPLLQQNAQQQSYYASCIPQNIPSEIVFPPLPVTSALYPSQPQVIARLSPAFVKQEEETETINNNEEVDDALPSSSPPVEQSPVPDDLPPLPDLTLESSSPSLPSSDLPASSPPPPPSLSPRHFVGSGGALSLGQPFGLDDNDDNGVDAVDSGVSAGAGASPFKKYWGQELTKSLQIEALEPGITLLSSDISPPEDDGMGSEESDSEPELDDDDEEYDDKRRGRPAATKRKKGPGNVKGRSNKGGSKASEKATKGKGREKGNVNVSMSMNTKKRVNRTLHKDLPSLPPLPTSPTLSRKRALATTASGSASSSSSQSSPTLSHPSASTSHLIATNPSIPTLHHRPCTPPRTDSNSTLHHAAIRTPLSFRGPDASPSSNIAFSKMNKDPPLFTAAFPSPPVPTHDQGEVTRENLRTPPSIRKRVGSASGAGPPVTPKKLVFPGSSSSGALDLSGSGGINPFRTPGGTGGSGIPGSLSLSAMGLGLSPFRTPGYGSSLDEELSRMRGHAEESPQGLFGKERKGVLYESPGVVDGSPSRWMNW